MKTFEKLIQVDRKNNKLPQYYILQNSLTAFFVTTKYIDSFFFLAKYIYNFLPEKNNANERTAFLFGNFHMHCRSVENMNKLQRNDKVDM